MAQPDPLRDDLTVYRGRAFGPYGWVLRDPATGDPLRSKTGLSAVASIQPHPEGPKVAFTAELVELVLPGDTQPVAAVMLSASAEDTAGWTFRTAVYDVLVDREGQNNPPGVAGRLSVERTVSA